MASIYEYLKSMDPDEIQILFRKAAEEAAYRYLDEHPELLQNWRSDHG